MKLELQQLQTVGISV